MPSLDCEQTLPRALAFASAWQHQSITVEAMLLALLDDPDARDALLACGADIDALRSITTEALTQAPRAAGAVNPRPDAAFQRVIERAEIDRQSAGRDALTGSHLLVGLFSEPATVAASILADHGVARDEVVRIVRGASRVAVLSRALESTIRRALACATERRHEAATLDHLFLVLLDDPDGADALRRSGADIEGLREAIAAHLDRQDGASRHEAGPTRSLQRVVQRAAAHVRDLGGARITGANILVELFSEADVFAVHWLAERGIGRLQVRAILEGRDDLREPS